jgi:molybdopterin converting factor small subunit
VNDDSPSKADGRDAITVRVLLFGAARDAAGGHAEFDLSLPTPEGTTTTGAIALAALLARHPALARFGRSLLFAVNCEYATPETAVKNGDELAVFPPVSGGAETPARQSTTNSHPHDFFELTTEAIDVGEVARRVVLRG